jgi:PAS domain S-box-containing protein
MKRVLIVDDNEQNLYLLRMLLQAHGHTVDEAREGAQALALARRAPPALIISDLLMPVMDGYTLLRLWKSDDALKAIPFVVYTATYTDPKDERLALALGADAFILKPAEPEPFMARIDEVLRCVNGAAAPGGAAPDSPPDGQRLLADYSEALVRKLAKRAQQLEHTNRELEAAVEESRRTAAALQASEERFRATFEQAAVGIAHLGVDGRCQRVNDKLCEITGHSRDELLGLALTDLAVHEDRPAATAALAAMRNGDQAAHACDTRYQRKDGGVIWASCVTSLLRDGSGQPQYFISVLSDITENKLLEEQFRQAQKIESIGQLTGGIAHDFNNLLTVIIGNAELLGERLAGDPDLHALAEMTRAAGQRGAELTRRLLAFARRQALAPQAVDVNALLTGMEGLLRRMLPEHIDIRLECREDLWPALVDPSQLEAAVLNLGINARDAMPAGGRLRITTRNVWIDGASGQPAEAAAAPGDYVQITVADTGTGIRPEHLAHVFEPFFTTKPPGAGTGLGLSMVHGFVKQSRGHVALQSQPGQGTAIDLFLPRTRRSEAAPPPAAAVPARLVGSQRILLVEDDDAVRTYAERQLLALGYRVTAVGDGEAALAVLRQRTDIDLLLTDVVMPGAMNGRELAHAARLIHPTLEVLFSSGYTEDDVIRLGLRDGRVRLLSKPYGRAELAAAVQAVLPAPGPAPQAAPVPRGGTLLILDDDPTVSIILGRSAETIGFRALQSETPQAFFQTLASAAPSHVAIDLTLPGVGGLQVLDRLAELGCGARVIIFSGADGVAVNAALAHGQALGLNLAGVLAKPFSMQQLAGLLAG